MTDEPWSAEKALAQISQSFDALSNPMNLLTQDQFENTIAFIWTLLEYVSVVQRSGKLNEAAFESIRSAYRIASQRSS